MRTYQMYIFVHKPVKACSQHWVSSSSFFTLFFEAESLDGPTADGYGYTSWPIATGPSTRVINTNHRVWFLYKC